jgi:hypothetical protein
VGSTILLGSDVPFSRSVLCSGCALLGFSEDHLIVGNVRSLCAKKAAEAAWRYFNVYIIEAIELPAERCIMVDEDLELGADIGHAFSTFELTYEWCDKVLITLAQPGDFLALCEKRHGSVKNV